MNLKKLQREKQLELRKKYNYLVKDELDNSIFEKIVSSKEYKECDSILTYVSMGFEVDTIKLINHSLKIGKAVYAPFVTKEKYVMKFYRVNTIDELVKNKMGILEPKEVDEWVKSKNTLCIVPALTYDEKGYRIGYGGGYYDYFLCNNKVTTIGIIYDEFVIDKIYIDKYDQKVEKIITDKRVIN